MAQVYSSSAAAATAASTPTLNLSRVPTATDLLTPSLLATHHLPQLLLTHGPQAIRHITAYLVTSLPGFSALTRGKQRRLVTSALELGVGGPDSSVLFEKVGWGKWGARRRGDSQIAGVTSMEHSDVESGVFMQESSADDSEDDDVDMDMDGSVGTSALPDEEYDSDATDDEDWESMGPELLRMRGTPVTSMGSSPAPGFAHLNWKGRGSGGLNVPGTSGYLGTSPAFATSWGAQSGFMGMGQLRAKEEQEAVEALLRLGSV